MSEDSCNFTCDSPGENSNATAKPPGMAPRQDMLIDGKIDLESFIHFNYGGRVYHISLQSSPGIYDYVLQVDAKGPEGPFSGSGHLEFTDESGDTYNLSIYSNTRSVHTVRYNSKQPNIVKVGWHN